MEAQEYRRGSSPADVLRIAIPHPSSNSFSKTKKDREKSSRHNSGLFAMWSRSNSKAEKSPEPKHKISERGVLKRRKKHSSHRGEAASIKDSHHHHLKLERSVAIEKRSSSGDDESTTSGSEHSQSSSDESSVDSISLENVQSNLQDIARELPYEARFLVKDVMTYIQRQDHEVRRAVTTITKMHKADSWKRDDTHFSRQAKVLRTVIENWSKTQNITQNITTGRDFGSRTKTALAEVLYPSPRSAEVGILGLVAPRYPEYLTGGNTELIMVMRAYLWAALMLEVFGRFRWAGSEQSYIDLASTIAPGKVTFNYNFNYNFLKTQNH